MNVKFKIGNKAKLSAQSKINGAFYLCKDVGELYYCDGTDFILMDATTNLKSITVNAGTGMSGGGTITSTTTNHSVTISHQSKPTTGNDAGGTGSYVTSVVIDSLGHVVRTEKSMILSELLLINFNVPVSYKHPATTSEEVSISSSTHKCGINPIVQVLNSSGEVVTCGITIGSTGTVTVTKTGNESITIIIKGEKSIQLGNLIGTNPA